MSPPMAAIRASTAGALRHRTNSPACPSPRCHLPPFPLGLGRVQRPQAVDLQGPPFAFQHRATLDGETHGAPPVTAGALFPAVMLLIGSESGGVSETRLVIVSLRGDQPAQIFSDALSSHHPGGGGFSTINSIKLESTGPGPLEINYSQTTVPGPSDKPFRPGPPLHRRFQFDGTRYQRK